MTSSIASSSRIASRTGPWRALLILVLTFGSTLRQDWESAGLRLIYASVLAALLAFRHYDTFSADGCCKQIRLSEPVSHVESSQFRSGRYCIRVGGKYASGIKLNGQTALAATQTDCTFWPNGARMVISVCMQMEAGAQAPSGVESPMPAIDVKYPDFAAAKWYEYGLKEGLPRMPGMFDRGQVKVTSHMVGSTLGCHRWLPKRK